MIAVVVGGTTGIGSRVTGLLASSHDLVHVVDVLKPTAAPDNVVHHQVDLGSSAEVDAFQREVRVRPDSIVLCASDKHLKDPSVVLQVGFVGQASIAQSLVAAMPYGSSVIAVGSISTSSVGLSAADFDALRMSRSIEAVSLWARRNKIVDVATAYEVSKAAIVWWVSEMAARMIDRGIRFNSVSPGPVVTSQLSRFREVLGRSKIDRAHQLLGRHASPGEIAKVVDLLSGPDFRWLNGVDLTVDGGLSNYLRRNSKSSESAHRMKW